MHQSERGCLMNFLDKLKKKRQQPMSYDSSKVVLETYKDLSETQKDSIITIVRNGIDQGDDLYTIGILILKDAIVENSVTFVKLDNGGIKVIV